MDWGRGLGRVQGGGGGLVFPVGHEGKGRVGGGVGTDKGTGKSTRTRLFRNIPVTPTPSIFQRYCRTNGGRTVVQMGGLLQYEWEAYCRLSLSSKLRRQESIAIQMGGVLPYKLEVYCRTF